jgi:hypothetical protein
MKKCIVFLTALLTLSAAAQVVITDPGLSTPQGSTIVQDITGSMVDGVTIVYTNGVLTAVSGAASSVGVTSNDVYRGDWGAAASNKAAAAYGWGDHAASDYATTAAVSNALTNVNAVTLEGHTVADIIKEIPEMITYYVIGSEYGPITNTRLARLDSGSLLTAHTNTATGVTNGQVMGAYSVPNDQLPDSLQPGIVAVHAYLSRTDGQPKDPKYIRGVLSIVESNGTTVVAAYTNSLPVVFPIELSHVDMDIDVPTAINLDDGLGRMVKLHFIADGASWQGNDTIYSRSQDGYLTRFTFPAAPAGLFATESWVNDQNYIASGSAASVGSLTVTNSLTSGIAQFLGAVDFSAEVAMTTTSVIVSGFGHTPLNGVYAPSGSLNGKPRYYMVGDSRYELAWYIGTPSAWWMWDTTSSSPYVSYVSSNNVANPADATVWLRTGTTSNLIGTVARQTLPVTNQNVRVSSIAAVVSVPLIVSNSVTVAGSITNSGSISAGVDVKAGAVSLTNTAAVAAAALTSETDPDLAAQNASNLDPTGFDSPAAVTVSYSSAARTITLSQSGGVKIWWRGTLLNLGDPYVSSAHTNVVGGYFLTMRDSTNIVWSTDAWTFDMAQVAYVYYGAAASWGLRETHGAAMDWRTHEALHRNVGTYRVSGCTPVAGTYFIGDGGANTAVTPAFAGGVIQDEDDPTTIAEWPENLYTTLHFSTNGAPVFNTNSTVLVRPGTTYPLVNTVVSSTNFLDVEAVNGRWLNYYQILAPMTADAASQRYRMVILQPQVSYGSLAAAQAEDVRTLNMSGFTALGPEYVFFTRVTMRTRNGNGTTGSIEIAGISYLAGSQASQTVVTQISNPSSADAISATGSWSTVQGAIDGLSSVTGAYVTASNSLSMYVGSLAATGTVTAAGYNTAGQNVARIYKGTYAEYRSVAIGMEAGTSDTNGYSQQTAIGYRAGLQSSGAFSQTAVGSGAGVANSGSDQIAVGKSSGNSNKGVSQIVIGDSAGTGNQGLQQIAIGGTAGHSNYGAQQIAIGPLSGFSNTSDYQIVIGRYAGRNNLGVSQLAIGYSAGAYNSGTYQTAIGHESGVSNKGAYQTSLGYESGKYRVGGTLINTNSGQSVYIGALTRSLLANDTNSIVVGYAASSRGSNTGVWGNSNIVNHYFSGSLNVYSNLLVTGAITSATVTATGDVLAGSASLTNTYAQVFSATRPLPVTTNVTTANAIMSVTNGAVQRWRLGPANITNVTFYGGGTNTESCVSWYILRGTNGISFTGPKWLDGKSSANLTNAWNLVVLQWAGTNVNATLIDGGAGSL